MQKYKLIDKIIKEPLGGAHYNKEEIFKQVKKEILSSFERIQKLNTNERIDKRREKFISMGNVSE